MDITIPPAAPPYHFRMPTQDDAAMLAAMARQSFIETFGHLYRDEDLQSFLTTHYTAAVLAQEIAKSGVHYCIAERDGAIVGYIKLGDRVSLDFPADPDVMELKQLYVLQRELGSGLGAMLMGWGVETARARGAAGMMLSVWSLNHRAQRFYQRYGFHKVGETYFMVGTHRDDEFVFGIRF